MLKILFFSPSGTTAKTARIFADEMNMITEILDLTVEDKTSTIELGEDDLVVFISPVYGGRIPPLAMDRFKKMKGHGQRAVVMVVYGNRDFDDALEELSDNISSQGFKIIGAGAFIAQHCIFPKVATGRPDEQDRLKIKEFVNRIKYNLDNKVSVDLGSIKGNRPYKKLASVPLHPFADKKKCNRCGTCVKECPNGAIPSDNPLITDKDLCMACCRCINVCPQKARKISSLLYKIAGWKFVKDNRRRLEPEWWV